MTDSIVIIHFQPLEWYPPVQNLIRVLENRANPKPIYVLTMRAPLPSSEWFSSAGKQVRIKRFGRAGVSSSFRLLQYLRFYAACIAFLIRKKPAKLLYFETLSSWPAYIYKKYINRRADIFIHYHEYTSTAEYASGMKLALQFHAAEKWLYARSAWLSHTNRQRMELFQQDIEKIRLPNPQIVPNYPPASWNTLSERSIGNPIKVVQVGSLGMGNMYCREFAQWIIKQNGNIVWDIYALQLDQETRDYLEGLHSDHIRFRGAVPYEQLQDVLRNYDLGVILYKGHIPNYIYNAPNKLFEYHVCGLDVWFPLQMITAGQYATSMTYPQIRGIDFEKLDEYDASAVVSRAGLHYWKKPFAAEEALRGLVKQLLA